MIQIKYLLYNYKTIILPDILQPIKKNFMKWYLLAFEKYALFNGRSRRSEFWYFQLFHILATIVLLGIGGLITQMTGSPAGFLLIGLYILATIIPAFALVVRRLHDTGRSGWSFLIGLIPLIGSVVLIVFYCQDSKPGVNKWGANPKSVDGTAGSNTFIVDDVM